MANKYRAWTAGEVLTAANLIDYVQKNVVIPCDSSADYPDSSTRREGMTVYDKDADKLLVYTTSTTGWVPPWNMPWGYINSATGTAQSGIGASATDLTGQSITFTATANRRYRILSTTHVYGASGYGRLFVQDGVNTLNVVGFVLPNTTNVFTYQAEAVVTLTSGSHTIKIQADMASGSLSTYVSTGYVLSLSIEDIGPNGAPA